MMNESLIKILSDQVNAEYYSAYLYLAMSAQADKIGLKGIANWFFVQAQEEMAHGTRIYDYILERGEKPHFAAIEAPESDFKDPLEMFEKTLAHEQEVTRRINAIATLALKENDHACYQFIMWFVNEQVEEEASASEILDKVTMIGDNKGLLLTIDLELAGRTFVDPFAE